MKQQLNYEDNIFILNTNIRMIADMLLLDADPDIFLEKTMEYLDFIGDKLGLLQETLTLNNQLISRKEQFHNLEETYERFLDLLKDILRGTGCFSVKNYPFIKDTVNKLIGHCINQQKIIKEVMAETGIALDNRLVSTDELTALLDNI
jgi:hypothetical protein